MFRILSLDGGGIKGAFTACVLATLEEDTGQSSFDHFDLIKLLFAGRMEAALAQASLLLQGRFPSINVVAKEGEFSLDDARPEKIQYLINLGRSEAVKKENLDVIKARFLNDTVAPRFKPLHKPLS